MTGTISAKIKIEKRIKSKIFLYIKIEVLVRNFFFLKKKRKNRIMKEILHLSLLHLQKLG